MSLNAARTQPFTADRVVAAIVSRTEHGNLHAGMLYRDGAGLGAVHLGWDDQLQNEWKWAGVWASPDAPNEKLVAAAGLCRLVWRRFERERRFPYALRFAGTSFDASGRLELGPGARGLTCATFVLAVMQSVGLPLVDEASWPVRGDADREFLGFVRPFAKPAHFAVLQSEVTAGVQRIWPDETVAACAVDPRPGTFAAVRAKADEVVMLLASAAPAP